MVATTTKLETSLIVAILDKGTLLMAQVALTTTGAAHVLGTTMETYDTTVDTSNSYTGDGDHDETVEMATV
jgi:hypothetical protein